MVEASCNVQILAKVPCTQIQRILLRQVFSPFLKSQLVACRGSSSRAGRMESVCVGRMCPRSRDAEPTRVIGRVAHIS